MATITLDRSETVLTGAVCDPGGPRVFSRMGPTQVCHGCGAVTGLYEGASYVRHEDARFCPACWGSLPGAEIERIVRAIALQGVPFS